MKTEGKIEGDGEGVAVEGQTTAFYIEETLKNTKVKISKLAQGVPAGGDLNYVDNNTLKQAFSWRRELEKK